MKKYRKANKSVTFKYTLTIRYLQNDFLTFVLMRSNLNATKIGILFYPKVFSLKLFSPFPKPSNPYI